jgi:tetratricopeptide (TPR) repeat protein
MGMEDTRLAAARALLAVDRTEAALSAVHQVLADQPSDADAWCLLAMCHRQGGDIPAALAAAERAVALRPDGDWAYRVYAEMLRKSGRLREAVAAARQAVSVAPDEWRSHVSLVHTLLDFGDATPRVAGPGAGRPALLAAREPMAQALRLAPDVPDAHVLAGRVHARLGEHELARDCWETALALDPANTAAQALLGRDALARGATTEGIAALRATLGADPTDPTVPATVDRIRAELVWRAARWSALVSIVLVAALLALSALGGPVRLWLTPVAVLATVATQGYLLRGYPEGWRGLAGSLRRRVASWGKYGEVTRVGILCLASHLLGVAWAGLAPAPLHPSLLTVPVYLLLAPGWLAPLVWLLAQPRRKSVTAARQLFGGR